jgi:hypothetical protein
MCSSSRIRGWDCGRRGDGCKALPGEEEFRCLRNLWRIHIIFLLPTCWHCSLWASGNVTEMSFLTKF